MFAFVRCCRHLNSFPSKHYLGFVPNEETLVFITHIKSHVIDVNVTYSSPVLFQDQQHVKDFFQFGKLKIFQSARFTHSCVKEIFIPKIDMENEKQNYHEKNYIKSDGANENNLQKSSEEKNAPKRKIVSPPLKVKGIKTLDKTLFDDDIDVLAVVVQRQSLQQVCKHFASIVLKVRKSKFVIDYPHINDENIKLVLLDPDVVHSAESFEPHKQKLLQKTNINLDTLVPWKVHLSYDNWNWTEIIDAILPEEIAVSTFSCIGHIAHLNLRPEMMEYKYIIGQVILEKHSNIKTVVNKLGQIDNKYRNFQMELLAGEPDFIAVVKEQGLQYKFDFSKVYWNSRLGTEHARVCKMLKRDDILFDVFAGVGPFAIPCAKKGIQVFANDLNPSSYDSMVDNMKLNRIKEEKMACYNMDGRDFIRSVVKDKLISLWTGEFNDHVIYPCQKMIVVMNLPAIAVEFLDEFVGILSDHTDLINNTENCILPHIACYGFQHVEGPDAEENFAQKAERIMGEKLPPDQSLHFVRDVSPNKLMVCLHFVLRKETMFRNKVTNVASNSSVCCESNASVDQSSCKEVQDDVPAEKKIKLTTEIN